MLRLLSCKQSLRAGDDAANSRVNVERVRGHVQQPRAGPDCLHSNVNQVYVTTYEWNTPGDSQLNMTCLLFILPYARSKCNGAC